MYKISSLHVLDETIEMETLMPGKKVSPYPEGISSIGRLLLVKKKTLTFVRFSGFEKSHPGATKRYPHLEIFLVA